MPTQSIQSPTPSYAQPGLRERKKRATRDALVEATVRLALRHGLDGLRVEDIATEANVSLRTFSNYFASKQEALAARYADRLRRAAAVLQARPADEPLWEAITQAILAPWREVARGYTAADPAALAEIRLLFGASAVHGEIARLSMAEDNAFALAVAARTGTDPRRDLYPRLVAATVTVATQIAIDAFLKAEPPAPLLPLLREALSQLSAGLADPMGLADPVGWDA